MPDERIRREVALIAARLMYDREESEYFTAKRKAARQLGLGDWHKPSDLPSNAQIREQIQALAQFYEGDGRRDDLHAMRLAAVRLMRLLEVFKPKLIGSVLTGHTRQGSDIDLHVFSATVSAITNALDDLRLPYTVERKRVRKHGEERVFTHVHLSGEFDFELTVYEPALVNYVFKSSITGGPIERATLPQLEALMREWYGADSSGLHREPASGGEDADGAIASGSTDEDANDEANDPARFDTYRPLLLNLERVKQSPTHHPEGDALYHSLQVFEHALARQPWDEEFLLAALLHDVGKALDAHDHVAAGLEALGESITPRTRWLIAHHMDAHAVADGTLGHRALGRLRAHEDFDDLMLLHACDKAGRVRGAAVREVDEVLAIVADLNGT